MAHIFKFPCHKCSKEVSILVDEESETYDSTCPHCGELTNPEYWYLDEEKARTLSSFIG